MSYKITIHVDDNGDAVIRSPQDISDDEVLDILTQAVDATADKIVNAEARVERTEALQEPLPDLARGKKYLN